MTTLVLAVLAIVLAGPVPWAMSRLPQLRRTPRAAMVLWQSAALAAVLAALGAGLALVTSQVVGEQSLLSYALSAIPLAITGLVLARLLLSGHLVGTRLRQLRRRHRRLVDLLAEDRGGVRVLEHEAPTAYCVPGLRSRVVISRGTVAALAPDELAAVLSHEQAHVRARHDLVLEAFTVLQQAYPAVVTSAQALEEVRLLVEVLADRAAQRRHGPAALVGALSALLDAGATRAPDGAVAAVDSALQVRLGLLLQPDGHRVQSTLLLLLAGAVLVLPTVLVVLPWVSGVVG
jgi:Zn-dependent protease with chaperone function